MLFANVKQVYLGNGINYWRVSSATERAFAVLVPVPHPWIDLDFCLKTKSTNKLKAYRSTEETIHAS